MLTLFVMIGAKRLNIDEGSISLLRRYRRTAYRIGVLRIDIGFSGGIAGARLARHAFS